MVNQKTLPQDSPYKFSNIDNKSMSIAKPQEPAVNIEPIPTPISSPKIETTISTKDMAKDLPTTEVVDSSGIVKNIQNTLSKYTAEAGANEDFIKGAIKASGQKETPELLAQYKGKKLGDVISGLGLGEKVGYTATPAPTIAPEAPKGTSSKINPATGEIINPTAEDIANYNAKYETVSPAVKRITQLEEEASAMTGNIDQAYKDAGVQAYAENVNKIQSEIDKLDVSDTVRGVMASIDAQDLKDQFQSIVDNTNIGNSSRSIILGESQDAINQKLQGLSSQQVRDLATYTLNRTNLVQQKMVAQGNYQIASDIAKQSAESMKWAYEQKLNLYSQLNLIDQDEKKELTTKNDDDFSKMEKGYVQISPELEKKYEQDILSGKAEGSIYTDVYGQKWFKPKDNDEELTPSEAKILGVPYGTTKSEAKKLGIVPTEIETLGGLTKDQLTQLSNIKSQVRTDPDVKGYVDVRDAYQRVLASAQNPSAAGDLALIFNYMKVLDPGSTVREGEFATAQNSGSIPETIKAKYNKVVSGERLSDDIRKDFVDRATALYLPKEKQYRAAEAYYQEQANIFGIPSGMVMRDYGIDSSANDLQEYYLSLDEKEADKLYEYQKTTGLNDEDFFDLIKQQQGFNQVGGDTNKAIVSKTIGGKTVSVNEKIADKIKMADEEMFRQTGKHISINQSYRTKEQQAELYEKLSKKGARVAPPGKSFHEKGLAIDVSNWKEAEPYLRKYGLLNNLADDKGHFSFGEFA